MLYAILKWQQGPLSSTSWASFLCYGLFAVLHSDVCVCNAFANWLSSALAFESLRSTIIFG